MGVEVKKLRINISWGVTNKQMRMEISPDHETWEGGGGGCTRTQGDRNKKCQP